MTSWSPCGPFAARGPLKIRPTLGNPGVNKNIRFTQIFTLQVRAEQEVCLSHYFLQCLLILVNNINEKFKFIIKNDKTLYTNKFSKFSYKDFYIKKIKISKIASEFLIFIFFFNSNIK